MSKQTDAELMDSAKASLALAVSYILELKNRGYNCHLPVLYDRQGYFTDAKVNATKVITL